jgi:hypothetical protein
VTRVPVLSDSAQLETWLPGIDWPSTRTRPLTEVPRHSSGCSEPSSTASCVDWRSAASSPLSVKTATVPLSVEASATTSAGPSARADAEPAAAAHGFAGAFPLAGTGWSMANASTLVAIATITIITRTAATSLLAVSAANCRQFLIALPIGASTRVSYLTELWESPGRPGQTAARS